jgi:hypothetical protein
MELYLSSPVRAPFEWFLVLALIPFSNYRRKTPIAPSTYLLESTRHAKGKSRPAKYSQQLE